MNRSFVPKFVHPLEIKMLMCWIKSQPVLNNNIHGYLTAWKKNITLINYFLIYVVRVMDGALSENRVLRYFSDYQTHSPKEWMYIIARKLGEKHLIKHVTRYDMNHIKLIEHSKYN